MNFKTWLENLDYSNRIMIVPKGTVLYHGTIESFDTRNPKPGGYDEVFWTAEDIMIARSYIPSKGSYSNVSVRHIIQDPGYENVRKSLGLSQAIIEQAWRKDRENYQKFKYW